MGIYVFSNGARSLNIMTNIIWNVILPPCCLKEIKFGILWGGGEALKWTLQSWNVLETTGRYVDTINIHIPMSLCHFCHYMSFLCYFNACLQNATFALDMRISFLMTLLWLWLSFCDRFFIACIVYQLVFRIVQTVLYPFKLFHSKQET